MKDLFLVFKYDFKVTKDLIKKILEDFDSNAKLISFQIPKEGIANFASIITYKKSAVVKKIVLKICNPLFESWKLEKEISILQNLRKKIQIPIPNVIYIND